MLSLSHKRSTMHCCGSIVDVFMSAVLMVFNSALTLQTFVSMVVSRHVLIHGTSFSLLFSKVS